VTSAADRSTLPAPATPTLVADPAWRRIDLLSDVHLQADMPRTFDAWRTHLLGTPADAVLMLGDLFEVWVGDDARHGTFEQACVDVLTQAARRLTLAFMPGNRDFLVGDILLAECGVQRLADPTRLDAFGQRWLLSHGDALCVGDLPYQRFRAEVRGTAWQQRFLAQPLPLRQQQARAMRDASSAHQAAMAPAMWSDVDDTAAAAWLRAAEADELIHGHTHRPGTHVLPGGAQRHVLGDWSFDDAPPRAQALTLTAAGLQPLDLAA
jgi:UDP-2,3-diacylglucosamine hydrolase